MSGPSPFPPGALVLLVGPPAAGKSTFAARLVEAGIVDAADVLSTDAYREALTGDASDTSADRRMWVQLRRDLVARMAAGRTTVVDATNVFERRRARHIRVAREHGRPVVAVRFRLGVEELLARNEARDRRVHDAAIITMAQQAGATPDEQLLAEGASQVVDAEQLRRGLADQAPG